MIKIICQVASTISSHFYFPGHPSTANGNFLADILVSSQKWWGDLTDRDTSAAMPTGCQLGHMYRAESMLTFLMQTAKSPLTFANDGRMCQYRYSIKFGVSPVKGSGKEKMTTWVGLHSAVYVCLIWHPLCMSAAGLPSVQSQCNVRDKKLKTPRFQNAFFCWLPDGCLGT